MFTELSVRRERARIARELHDIVAHHLAVVVVQAGAGRMAALGPGRLAPERFAVIRDSCKQTLTEMARLVDILQSVDAHDQPPPVGGGCWPTRPTLAASSCRSPRCRQARNCPPRSTTTPTASFGKA